MAKYNWAKRLVNKITKKDCPNNNYFWYYNHEINLQSGTRDYVDCFIDKKHNFTFDFWTRELEVINGTYNLLDKHGNNGKELSKLAKIVIEQILLSFTEKKVYKSFTHPILYNELNFKFANVAKVKANLIFKEFIAEYKEKLK